MSLKGRTALVTGSTSGIGLGIATALAAEGADILLNGFGDHAAIEAIGQDLRSRFAVRTAYSPADVSEPAMVAQMVAQAGAELGGVDILVNNAGIQFTAAIEDFPAGQWDRILAVNLSGAFHAMQAAIPAMRARGWGRIVNIASAHALVASASKAAYVAAKHGLLGLTKVAAIELAGSGMTCNAICPGWVLTPLVQRQLEERATREDLPIELVKARLLREKQPLAEFTTPEQIGALVVFLCSDAARTLTGAPLSVDGGWTAQ